MPESRAGEIFLQYFQTNKDQVYEYALRMTGSSHDAGDISQEVFIKLFEKRDNLAGIKNIKAWLIVITRNLCLNHLRNKKREVPLEQIESTMPLHPNGDNSNYAILEKAMKGLKTKFREVLILREYQGFSYEEISEILQTTVSAVKSMLFNARTQLSENFHKINNGRII